MRVLLFGLLAYVMYKAIRNWGVKTEKKETVQGKGKTNPLDLKHEDIEDARFEDIDEKKRT